MRQSHPPYPRFLRRRGLVSLRSTLLPLLFAAACLALSVPGLAQTGGNQQQDITQGEHCLRQMERDPQGSITLARNLLAQEDASDLTRMMALACLVRSHIMPRAGAQAQSAVP